MSGMEWIRNRRLFPPSLSLSLSHTRTHKNTPMCAQVCLPGHQAREYSALWLWVSLLSLPSFPRPPPLVVCVRASVPCYGLYTISIHTWTHTYSMPTQSWIYKACIDTHILHVHAHIDAHSTHRHMHPQCPHTHRCTQHASQFRTQ